MRDGLGTRHGAACWWGQWDRTALEQTRLVAGGTLRWVLDSSSMLLSLWADPANQL